MKKLLLSSLLLILLYSCSKTDNQINDYFNKNLKDPSSLEIIEKEMSDVTVAEALRGCILEKQKEFKANPDIINLLGKDKTILGKIVEVKYRASNSFGAKSISNLCFLFSNDEKLLEVTEDKFDARTKSCNHLFNSYYFDSLYFEPL